MSVDEAYLDLSDRDAPAALAAEVQERVIAETRLPTSVGLATSKLVAKVASDFGKPEGRVIVPPGTEADFTTFTRRHTVEVPIDSDEDIRTVAEALWRDNWPPGQPVRLLGVGVSNLSEAEARQLGMDLDL